MTLKPFVERDLREMAIDEDRRLRGAAGVIGIDLKDFVSD